MAIADRRERERKQRSESILAAAKELFRERGYQLTTMERIAERAELNKATLYLYFASKDELYATITLEGIEELEARLERALEKASGPEERIRTVFNIFVDHCLDNPELFRITQYFLSGAVRENLPPRIAEEIGQVTERLLGQGGRALKDGMEQGLFRKGLDPELFAFISWRMATGLLDLSIMGGPEGANGATTDRRIYEEALEILVQGIKNIKKGVMP